MTGMHKSEQLAQVLLEKSELQVFSMVIVSAFSPLQPRPCFQGWTHSAVPPKQTADELRMIYNDLVGYGFQQADIQVALTTVKGSSLRDALDWLCMHVPPGRLPHRFAGMYPTQIGHGLSKNYQLHQLYGAF
jgi:hypothetical protein